MAEVSPTGFFAKLFGRKNPVPPAPTVSANQKADHVQRFTDAVQRGSLPSYPFDAKGIELVPPEALIDGQKSLILKIRQRANCASDTEWQQLYMATIYDYACWVHCLPASESHHHSAPTGLFRHGLEVAVTTMNLGYKYCNDINNAPSLNRLLQASWPFACFVAGLFHDIGKPLSDVEISGPDGAVLTALSEPVYHWAKKRGYPRYFFRYKADRHENHKSLGVLVLGMALREKALDFLNPVKDKSADSNLMLMIVPAVEGSGSPTNPLIRFVQQADQASVAFDRKNIPSNPSPDEEFVRKPTVPGRFIDALRALVESGAIVANKPDGKHWMIADAAHFLWPAIVDDVVASVAKTDPLPNDYSLLLNALTDFNYLSMIGEDKRQTAIWRVRLGLHQSKSVIDTVCIRDIKNIYRHAVPASIDAEIVTPTKQLHAQDQQSTDPHKPEPAQHTQLPPPTQTPSTQTSKAEPGNPDPGAKPSGITSEYLKADPMPLGPATPSAAPAPKPSSPSDHTLSAPSANDPNTARLRLQTLDHGLGPYLIDIAKSLRDEPHYRQLVTTLNDRLVLCFPDAVCELGMEPKELSKKFAAASILETNMEGGGIKKAPGTLGFEKAIVLDLKHSKDILRVAGNPQLPSIADIKKARKAVKAQQPDLSAGEAESFPTPPPPSGLVPPVPAPSAAADQESQELPPQDMPPDMPPEFYEQAVPAHLEDSLPDYDHAPAAMSAPDMQGDAPNDQQLPAQSPSADTPPPAPPPATRTFEIQPGMSVLDLLNVAKPAAQPPSALDVHARVRATVGKIKANYPDHYLDAGSGPVYVSSVHFSQNLGLSRDIRQAYLNARGVRQIEHPSIGQSLAFPRDLLESAE